MVEPRPKPALKVFAGGQISAEISPLVKPSRPAAFIDDRGTAKKLAVTLLSFGLLSAEKMLQVLETHEKNHGQLADHLLTNGLVESRPLFRAIAAHWSCEFVDLEERPPDIRLIDQLGPNRCLRLSLLPWRQVGGVTLICTPYPELFSRHLPRLTRHFGRVAMVVCEARALTKAVLTQRGTVLAQMAEVRVPEPESCRSYSPTRLVLSLALFLFLAIPLTIVFPRALIISAAIWVIFTLFLAIGLKAMALWATRPAPHHAAPSTAIARLPVVSVMVAMYHEADIAPRLVRRLGRLEYPSDLLDIVLVVEEEDHVTRTALASAALPPWMRIVVVPCGQVRTKPRALNFALDHCRGSLIGIYDAEDAPEPDQIHRIVERFHNRDQRVACLQGRLDFYNPHKNWLSRCFTMEYAGWFRVILPGLERLGLPIPLGGTTLFFRRSAIEALGGWDAHNVTEDADLGIRLCRHGFRTEVIDTTTYEEANCRALPWVKQRSRWIKGYMMTWATHMRSPRQLFQQLGPKGFLGFQVLFLGSLSQALLLPLLWSFWLLHFGLPGPLGMTATASAALTTLFLLAEGVNLAIGFFGLRRSGHRINPLWLLTLPLYYPLATLAAYKAAWELITAPFYWDKTAHGDFGGLNDL